MTISDKRKFFLLLSLIIISLFTIKYIQLGKTADTASNNLSIIIQYYGVSSEEIEKTITRPIEEEIKELGGIKEVRSYSEFSKSRIDIKLNENIDSKQFYLDLRDNIDKVYTQFPKAVQRPRIVSSSLSQKPFMVISFNSETFSNNELHSYLEKEIKPEIEKIKGISEIDIGGGSPKEIHINVDEYKLIPLKMDFNDIASIIQSYNSFEPLGYIIGNKRINITLDGSIHDIDEIRNISIASNIKLSDIADIDYSFREKDSSARVNNEERVNFYLKNSGNSNILKTSSEVKKTIKKLENEGYDISIIYDLGDEIGKGLRSLGIAIMIAIICVSLFIFLSLRNVQTTLAIAISIPLITFFTISLLSIQKIIISPSILAGIGIGIGLIVDNSIIITEFKKKNNSILQLLPVLFSSTLTTIIVLIPLLFLKTLSIDIYEITLALLIFIVVSFIFCIFFLPSMIQISSLSNRESNMRNLIKRLLTSIISKSLNRKIITIAITCGILIISILIIMKLPFSLENQLDENYLFYHAEFESGASLESVDNRCSLLTKKLLQIPGVNDIDVKAHTDNAQFTIEINTKLYKKSSLNDEIKKLAQSSLKNGSFHQLNIIDRKSTNVEVIVLGPDNTELQEIARSTINILSKNLSWIESGVLHFKENPKSYIMKIDNINATQFNVSPSYISNYLRWYIQGPVAIKVKQDQKEIDLRIMSKNKKTAQLEDLPIIPISVKSNDKSLNLAKLGTFIFSEEPSKIFRYNNQRAAYFSIRSRINDIQKIEKDLWKILSQIEIPQGYSFRIDKKIKEKKEFYNKLIMFFILSLLLIYIVLAALNESFITPFLLMSIIPTSLMFPVIFLFILKQPLDTSVIISFIILIGIVVNNAILLHDDIVKSKVKSDVDKVILSVVLTRLKTLIMTTGTTIIGALPLLLSGGRSLNFNSKLALVMVIGIIFSLLLSITFIPALFSSYYKRNEHLN